MTSILICTLSARTSSLVTRSSTLVSVTLAPTDPTALVNRGDIYLQTGAFDLAAADFGGRDSDFMSGRTAQAECIGDFQRHGVFAGCGVSVFGRWTAR